MYIRKSIRRASGNPGLGLQPRDLLVLYNTEDILYMPQPDSRGVLIEENIVLRPGCYGIELYMTPGTIEITSAAEGDFDKVGFTPSIKFSHPGNTQEVREFKTNEINGKFIAVVRYCSGRPSDLIGTVCNPCRITPSYTANSDGNTNEFTVQQISKGSDIFIYTGTVTLEEPVAEVAAGPKLTYAGDGKYLCTAEGVSINAIEGGQPGAVITIEAGGPAPATVSASGSGILLAGGREWTGANGSQITLRAFSAGEQGLLWVEQSRYSA